MIEFSFLLFRVWIAFLFGRLADSLPAVGTWSEQAFADFFAPAIAKSPSMLLVREQGVPEFQYGETQPAALERVRLDVLEPLAPVGAGDVFADLGSGRGLCAWWAALRWGVGEAIGIELSAERHSAAALLLAAAAHDGVASAEESSEDSAAANVIGGGRLVLHSTDAMQRGSLWSHATIAFSYIRELGDDARKSLVVAVRSLSPGAIVISHESLFGCHGGLSKVGVVSFEANVFAPLRMHVYAVARRPGLSFAWGRQADKVIRLSADARSAAVNIDNDLEALRFDSSTLPSDSDLAFSTGQASVRLLKVMNQRASNLSGAEEDKLSADCSGGLCQGLLSMVSRIEILGDSESAWECLLDTLYWAQSGRRIGNVMPLKEVRELRSVDDFRHTYGEIEPRGIRQMLSRLGRNLTGNDVVIDLGHGAGKLLLQLLLDTPVGLVRGVELSATRYNLSTLAFTRLVGANATQITPRGVTGERHGRGFVLEQGDLFNTSVAGCVLVYCNTQAFSDGMIEKFGWKMSRELAQDAMLVLLGRELSGGDFGLTKVEVAMVPGNAKLAEAHIYWRSSSDRRSLGANLPNVEL